jgi:protein tyrosine/serine phosphatase
MSNEVDAEAISNDPSQAAKIDPSYQPYHDIQPPANTTSNPTPPMEPPKEEEQIQPPKDFTEHFPSRLPVPPFIHVQGVPNFRDMGGYECPPPPSLKDTDTAGKTYMVRKNLLFRCAHPTQLTQHGAATLRNLGITNIYDLRSATEIEKLAHSPPATPTETQTKDINGQEALDTSNGYIVIPGITRTFTPVYTREDYSPVALARKLQWYTSANLPDKNYSEGFVNAYRDIATYGAKGGSYAIIIRQALKGAEYQAKNPILGRRRRPTSAVPDLDFLIKYQDGVDGEILRGAADTAVPSAAGGTSDTIAGDNAAPDRKQDGGLIFHCTAGKDRTGVLAGVLLYLLRVPIDAICWEYAITEPGLGSWRDLFIERISQQGMGGPNRDQALKKPGQTEGESGESEAGKEKERGAKVLSKAEAARICSSRASNMRAFLTQILDGEFGGAEKYLIEMVGLGVEEVERLKEVLVVEVKEEGEVVKYEGVAIEGWTLEEGMVGDRDLEGAEVLKKD